MSSSRHALLRTLAIAAVPLAALAPLRLAAQQTVTVTLLTPGKDVDEDDIPDTSDNEIDEVKMAKAQVSLRDVKKLYIVPQNAYSYAVRPNTPIPSRYEIDLDEPTVDVALGQNYVVYRCEGDGSAPTTRRGWRDVKANVPLEFRCPPPPPRRP